MDNRPTIPRALLLLAALLLAAPAAATDSTEFDLYFEVKLLVRERLLGRRIAVDQWAAGRLRMDRTETDGCSMLTLVEVLETPWTFRWYPTLDEAKLGAAVHVERPSGDPYGALASGLEPLAREKHRLWWASDPVVAGAPWSAETGRFWAARHSREEIDPLPDDPTYPFHVLGPLAGRFSFSVCAGAVDAVVERISSPWLRDGWSRAVRGEPVHGYGYWEPKRPRWEPAVYEAFAAALELLAWPPEEPRRFSLDSIADLVTTLQPRARATSDKLPRGEPLVTRGAGGAPVEIEISDGSSAGHARLRAWRKSSARSDELQLLIDDQGDERFKLWVRVGYGPAAD